MTLLDIYALVLIPRQGFPNPHALISAASGKQRPCRHMPFTEGQQCKMPAPAEHCSNAQVIADMFARGHEDDAQRGAAVKMHHT